jgi:hypothetical protein
MHRWCESFTGRRDDSRGQAQRSSLVNELPRTRCARHGHFTAPMSVAGRFVTTWWTVPKNAVRASSSAPPVRRNGYGALPSAWTEDESDTCIRQKRFVFPTHEPAPIYDTAAIICACVVLRAL